MPPPTTKRRTTTNSITKNNQNCQKIELYGNLATKELTKKYSSRLLGGMKGSWGREGLQAGGRHDSILTPRVPVGDQT